MNGNEFLTKIKNEILKYSSTQGTLNSSEIEKARRILGKSFERLEITQCEK